MAADRDLGTPAILVSLAGNGWLRGVQDTVRPLRYVVAGFGSSALLCPLLVYGWLGLPRWGLTGSAVANLVGQWLAALLFAGALLAERVSLRPDRAVLGAQLMMARDLIVRTLAFQVCYVSAAAVAASSALPRSRPTRSCCSCGVFLRWFLIR